MIEPLTFLLLGGVGIGIGLLRSHGRLQRWQAAAVSCGLKIASQSPFLRPNLEAFAGEVRVKIETCGNKGRLTRIAIKAPEPWRGFNNVSLRPESILTWPRQIEIGDRSFDDTFAIDGPLWPLLAAFDAETRGLLRLVQAESRLQLSSGQLRAEMSDRKVGEVLPLLLKLSRRFARPLDLPRRLAENAGQDPEPGVRLQNLLVLIRELPEAPATAEALRKACSDPSPAMRLQAARELGAEGHGILLAIAEGPDDALSAQAVAALGGELPFERAKDLLGRASGLQTARACLEALARHGAAAVEVLAKVLEEEEGALAPDAARALGDTGSPAAEPPLIQALQREQKALQVAAANALARVGSVTAVLPLEEAADGLFPGELRRAARQAIAEIQSRVQGAAPGQLSLAGAETGQLSLAQEGGELSLAENPEGQLSLPPEERPE
jgi:HEAT repeat protein